MFDAILRPRRAAHQDGDPETRAAALPLGTIVLTMEGALPVEYLSVGDRIITRAGARTLRDIQGEHRAGHASFRLGFDASEVIYADGLEVRTASPR